MVTAAVRLPQPDRDRTAKATSVASDIGPRSGFELRPVADAHLCCGSAGTYSVLQPELSERLLARKLAALEAGEPELIATANIGCLAHLQGATERRVLHWIRLLDPHPA